MVATPVEEMITDWFAELEASQKKQEVSQAHQSGNSQQNQAAGSQSVKPNHEQNGFINQTRGKDRQQNQNHPPLPQLPGPILDKNKNNPVKPNNVPPAKSKNASGDNWEE